MNRSESRPPRSNPNPNPKPNPNPRPKPDDRYRYRYNPRYNDNYIYYTRANPRYVNYTYDEPAADRKCVVDLLNRVNETYVGYNELNNIVDICDIDRPKYNYTVQSREGFDGSSGLIDLLINLIIIVFLILILCYLLRLL